MPTEGSDPAAALRLAAGAFAPQPSARAILLVSDGELPDPGAAQERELLDTAAMLQRQGISLYTLGVGTGAGATLLAPQGGWLHHEGGSKVSRLQEARLRAVATRGNGSYATVSDTDAEWRELYDHGIGRLATARSSAAGDGNVIWREHYPAPLALAAILLLLGHWRPRRHKPAASLPVLCLAATLAILLPTTPSDAAGHDWSARAHHAWSEGNYVEARRLYARIPGYAGRMGEGASAYRTGQYRDAIGPFTEAILAAEDDRQRADALFNLANSHYRLEDYATAVEYYRDVLRYRPDDAAASVNLAYAEALQREQMRRGEAPGSTRPGRGPRGARLAEGTDITRGSVMLDEETAEAPPPALPDGSPSTADDLINRGIRYARPAARRLAEQHDDQWVYAATPPERIELEAATLQVDQSLLWKRIFESEEGFMAPQEQPYELPGVTPW
jgi:Ca-activated chloride channel family protein